MSRVALATPRTVAVLKPLYSQVRDMLATRISGSEWGPGAMLPNETNLAAAFGVSIGTIRRAVEGLEDMGLVVRKQGRGTYVGGLGAKAAAERLCRLRGASGGLLKLSAEIDSNQRRAATANEIVRLRLPGPAEVLEIRTSLVSRGQRIGVETSVLPGAIASQLRSAPGAADCLYSQLGSCGILVTAVEESLSSAVADAILAQALRTSIGVPILIVHRLALGVDQHPVEMRHSTYLGHHVSYANRVI